MSANWWAERLSGAKPVTPPSTTQQPRQPVYIPPGPGQQQYVPQTHQAYPQQQPAPPPGYAHQGHSKMFDPRLDSKAEIHVMDAINAWKGGEAHRKEGDWHCPECGSQHFYSRSKGGMAGKPPAPRCFECGYVGGLFTQADESNWA